MAKKTKTVKELNLDCELLFEKLKKIEEKDFKKDQKLKIMEITLKNYGEKNQKS